MNEDTRKTLNSLISAFFGIVYLAGGISIVMTQSMNFFALTVLAAFLWCVGFFGDPYPHIP